VQGFELQSSTLAEYSQPSALGLMADGMGFEEVLRHAALWFEDIEPEMEGGKLEAGQKRRPLCPKWTDGWCD
jgi:hypothetical protein